MERKRKASEIRAARKQLRAVTSVRRSVFYFMRAILVVLVIGALCILAFMSGARISNAYILVNEGMSARADCMLKNGEENELTSYFSLACIDSDSDERSNNAAPYAAMTVSSYEYSLKIGSLHVFPWQIGTYVDVVEQIRNVKGVFSAESGGSGSVPDWTPRKYRLHLGKAEGRWLIEQVELLELNPKLDPPATPDPDAEPLPMVTPSPVPTPEPSPTPDEVIFNPND
ncbi:MAG: hypothetical protein IKZ44_00760 [Clostridia bacterium]|nr:hypothetical protein [Clostridia bacterium]